MREIDRYDGRTIAENRQDNKKTIYHHNRRAKKKRAARRSIECTRAERDTLKNNKRKIDTNI